MPNFTTVETVKGGRVMRDLATGRFIEVRINEQHEGQSKSVRNPTSASALTQASSKRSAALERLKNR